MKYLIFGGTGSLGKTLTERFLKERHSVCVFSRSEEKHVNIKKQFPSVNNIIGDVRDYDSVFDAINYTKPDIVINCSALKNVPEVECFPSEGFKTNVIGAENICKASDRLNIHKALFVSTDKACKPVNSYGMTKALAERIHLTYNVCNRIRNVVRYGNVLSSRGSVIPYFKERILNDQKLTITDKNMTRFFLSLSQSVDLISYALKDNEGGKTFIPKINSARITDLAQVICEFYGKDPLDFIEYFSIRPGEKIHEILISEEEMRRLTNKDNVFVINNVFSVPKSDQFVEEYCSKDHVMNKHSLKEFLLSSGVFL